MKGAALLAASMVSAAFGGENLEVLASRGYLVLQGPRAERRLAAVHWKSLESLASAADSCRLLSAPLSDGPDSGLDACRALPPDGAMTPGLHLLAGALAAEHEESRALRVSSAPLAEPAGLENLFETPWGREWALRRHALRLEDPSPLVKGFFEEFLAGPRPDAEAARHFLAVTAARGASGAPDRLAEDAVRGAASEELRGWIRSYLLDERRRRGLKLARRRVDALRADKRTLRELRELGALTAALSSKPGLLASLEAALSASPAASDGPRLLSAGLHLQESARLQQHELGDEAVVSGAYWVDGLPEGAAVEVEETSFLETSRGFSAVESRVLKRRNGGPYPFARRLRIDEGRPFSLGAVVSAAGGAAIAERAEIPVGPDYGLAVEQEAEALSLSLSCDPKSAEAAYAALAALVADAAEVKPQYKDLLERAREGRAKAAEDAETLARLEGALAAARADGAPRRCLYDTEQTDAAIELARRLPAGCDRVLPELFALRAAVSRRAADQAWFLRASAEARSRRRACDFESAARRWSQALGVLEADPAARCGQVAVEAERAEAELAEAQVSLAWTEQLDKALVKAEAETVPARRLESLHPARSRLASLPDRECRRGALKRAARAAEQAGEDERGPSDADALRRLPRETTPSSAVEEVKRARARLLERADAAALPPPPPAAAPEPAPGRAKPAAVKRKKGPAVKRTAP